MPKAKRTKAKRTRKSSQVGAKKLPLLSLLIIECDSRRLASESISIAGEFDAIRAVLSPRSTSELLRIESQDELKHNLANLSEKFRGAKAIILIGHSNRDGIRIRTDPNTNFRRETIFQWETMASWISWFRPKHLVIVACEAGQWPSKQAFFSTIRELKSMFASPVTITADQANILKLLVPYLLSTQRIDPELVRWGQFLTFFTKQAVILYCTRKDTEWNRLIQNAAAALN